MEAAHGAGSILVVDDERSILTTLEILLTNHGHAVETATTLAEARDKLQNGIFDLVLTDLRLSDGDGTALVENVKTLMPGAEVILITAHGTIEAAVDAMRRGAFDFIIKPIDTDKLTLTITKALRHQALESEVRRLRREFKDQYQFKNILGQSPRIKQVLDIVQRVAETDVAVLIEGENGTGKNVIARAVHNASKRRERPFVTVNCSGLNESLLDSDLFGHTRGAFTGAVANRKGLFEEAEGGTILLDEVGSMPPSVQAKLLNVLQEKTFYRLGSSKTQMADVRVLAASNRDLASLVKSGTFREDLYFRLKVVELRLPPLRERREDIYPLAQGFLAKYAGVIGKPVRSINAEAMSRLMAYSWPGNVRELENCIESSVALAQGGAVTSDDLPPALRDSEPDIVAFSLQKHFTLEDMEKRYIHDLLKSNQWQQKKTAKILGIGRNTLWRKIHKYGIEIPQEGA